jgi:hypothetical protein
MYSSYEEWANYKLGQRNKGFGVDRFCAADRDVLLKGPRGLRGGSLDGQTKELLAKRGQVLKKRSTCVPAMHEEESAERRGHSVRNSSDSPPMCLSLRRDTASTLLLSPLSGLMSRTSFCKAPRASIRRGAAVEGGRRNAM